MQTSVEDLAIEIWIFIFSYLDAQDIFYSFTKLNNYFDRLLSSKHLLFNVRLKRLKDNLNENIVPLYSYFNGILKRLIYLESPIEHEYEDIPEYLSHNTDKLIRLKTLKIRTNKFQTNILCQILSKLPKLEYLSMTGEINSKLLNSILSMSTLRVCQLEITEVEFMNSPTNKISNIERLYILCLNSQNNSFKKFFNCHMPKLKRLEICQIHNLYLPEDKIIESIINFPQIRILKLKGENAYPFILLRKHLRSILPSLKILYIDNYQDFIGESFLSNLINQWWSIIDDIEQINISIKGITAKTPAPNLLHYRKRLLSKNNDYNNDIKITWIQKNPNRSNMMDCSIQILKNFSKEKRSTVYL